MCIRDRSNIFGNGSIKIKGIGAFFVGVPTSKDVAVAPVSYTHLDVYKRQEEGSGQRGAEQGGEERCHAADGGGAADVKMCIRDRCRTTGVFSEPSLST